MIAEKIEAVRIVLNDLAGRVSNEAWVSIRGVQSELADAQRQIAEIEQHFVRKEGEANVS